MSISPPMAPSAETRELKTVSVGHFLKVAQRGYVPKYRASPAYSKPLASHEGSQLRQLIQESSGDKLHELIAQMYTTGEWALDTLAHQEISLLLQCLVNSHKEMISTANKVKNLVPEGQKKVQYLEAHGVETSINRLYSHLITNGYALSISDMELIIAFEAQSLNYTQAAKLLDHCEAQGLHSLTLCNLRLGVLARCSPDAWLLQNSSQTLTRRRFGAQQTETFATLLKEFARATAQLVPNLQSHKLVMGGFAKNGDLQQVRLHIHRIWGISMDDSMPSELVPFSSSLFPDEDLLMKIVQMFGYNGHVLEGLEYVQKLSHSYRIDTSRSARLWLEMANFMSMETRGDAELRAQQFSAIWNAMVHDQVRISDRLWIKRAQILCDASMEKELIKSLKDLQMACVQAPSQMLNYRLERALSENLKLAAAFVYRNEGDDESVTKLFESYAVSRGQLEQLKGSMHTIKEAVKEQRDKFEELQRQYDEEDDEGSLW